YGVPSVKARWYGEPRRAGSVSRTVFWPVPNVDSGLVALVRRGPPAGGRGPGPGLAPRGPGPPPPRENPPAPPPPVARPPAAAAEDVLRRAGVDPSARGEQLDVTDFARIAGAAP